MMHMIGIVVLIKLTFSISDEPFKEETVKRYAQLSGFLKPYLKDFKIIDSFSSYARYQQAGVDLPLISTDIIEDFEGKVSELNV
jgi:hypothetical protein